MHSLAWFLGGFFLIWTVCWLADKAFTQIVNWRWERAFKALAKAQSPPSETIGDSDWEREFKALAKEHPEDAHEQ